MAQHAQTPGTPATPPPERKTKPRRGGKNNQDRPSFAGKTKLCYRTTVGEHSRPATIWADKRHRGDMGKEIAQLQAAKIRVDNNPAIPGIVEWAAIYDCSSSRFGPEILTYKQGAWHTHGS